MTVGTCGAGRDGIRSGRFVGVGSDKTPDRGKLEVAGVEPEEVPATPSVGPRPKPACTRLPVADFSRLPHREVRT